MIPLLLMADSSPESPPHRREPLQVALQATSSEEDSEAPDTAPSTTNGLAHLVLSLVNLLHELLEKQAIRRMDNGTLTADEVERIGQTLQKQAAEIEELCDVFDLDPSELSLPLNGIETHGLD